jgi:hypothetical protein
MKRVVVSLIDSTRLVLYPRHGMQSVVDEIFSFVASNGFWKGEKRDGHNRPCERRWDLGPAGMETLLREGQEEDTLFLSGEPNACFCLGLERYGLTNGHCAECQNIEISNLSCFFLPWRRQHANGFYGALNECEVL